ncbi:SC6A3-like protein [Mya arenaria]|uniref:SC6A3-like protein n=1 Tax=Mya arenaria TaxID=6604 RepID=A0ABY7E3K1_MYAAR|nr:SC6A3-like protein [Mya arenaria]
MELALGQYQRCGCITVWKRICPVLKGFGFATCIIARFVTVYQTTIISWAVFYFFSSMRSEVWIDAAEQFGGLEAISTGILDEWPHLRKRREIFVLGLVFCCFCGGLATTTNGGIYLVRLLDTYGAPISSLFIACLEAVAVSWIYGASRFASDIEAMLGPQHPVYWWFLKICWMAISPIILLILFILSLYIAPMPYYGEYEYPTWSIVVGWLLVCSSLVLVPAYAVYKICITPGTVAERIRTVMTPEEVHENTEEMRSVRIFYNL